ncbi:MAG: SAM-dependent chlorinase/fluorinase [Acidobacteriota bacterium]
MALVALLTDFGARDHYVASMKGVILNRCDARVVDLSHEIPPYDVFAAALFLRSVAPAFYAPENGGEATIFVIVVDPGVGTERRIVAARENGLTFLAPDNGLLSLVLTDRAVVHSVENESWFLPNGSRTFEGRDRFAPVAAALARGIPPEELGPRIELETLSRLYYEEPSISEDSIVGRVVALDHFGNVITDIPALALGDPMQWTISAAGVQISSFAEHYQQDSEEPFFVVGSSGTIEISIANGSAAAVLQIRRFARVEALRSTR